ncbi:MAG TPA: hypothetical protein VMD51_06820, partial [Mycobacterium sp.]|nr:hypothetical protein [Mycobacterium sp.]
RNMFGIGQFGGQIIDGDIVRVPLDPDRDNFEEWSISLNIESTAHYTAVTVLNDGSDGGPAVIRATGVDDLIDFINPSSTVASFGFLLPASADDNDIPVTVTTDYILEPGTNYVRVETTVQNTGGSLLNIFFGEYINGSGEVQMFQPGYGFGEPLATSRCPITPQNLCNFTAYSGYDNADGVSYGYIQQVPGSTTFTTSGVHVPQLKVAVVAALTGLAGPPFAIQPSGNPGDSLELTRYFVVGDGPVSTVSDARNEIQCLPTGRVEGTVTAGGVPTKGVDIAVLGDQTKGPGTPTNVVTHTRTDSAGHYSLTLPPGAYNVAANLEHSPYEGGGSTAIQHLVNVTAFSDETQDIAIPATGGLQVLVKGQDNAPIPAKVSVVGFDPSPDPLNKQSILGLISNTTGVFEDRTKDAVPFGLATFGYAGTTGDTGVLPLEPGSYQVVVSHGPEYSNDAQNVTITAGSTQVVHAKVEHVIDSTGFVSADFHVHSIDSPDSQIPHVDRLMTMIADGMDFFTPTDHDYRYDYQPLIDSMGLDDLLGTAVGEEITSFDYGHFNAWPLKTDPSQVNHGGADFGGAAPAGQDYPSFGNYNVSPAGIVALGHADAVGASNTVQINHIHSHFGLDGGSGLAIDTGTTPPQSQVPAAARRLDPSITNFFTNTFDALEIWIGDDRQGQILTNFLGQNIGDWFNMINQGIVRTGVADSDSHKHAVAPAGFPRNMVASPTDDPSMLSGIADTLSNSINAGRNVGTDGPMVRVSTHAASTGQTGKLELGSPTTISTTDGAVDITVSIQSPTWAEFDRVEYYINTTTTQVLKPNQQTGAGIITMKRYTITPDFVQTKGVDFTVNTVPVAGTTSNRLEATTTLSLTGLTQDIWVVVLVKGTDGVSHPLFPMIPNSIKTSTNATLSDLTDGNLGEDGVLALAFTNPLFVDVDGGGWTAPGVHFH